jgi:diaminohydroxyphosphoribosylaminopyrimidine deaminase/5-amino-6-(5-phosphoribosylamino)uracil reductase
VVGLLDPNPLVAGKGLEILRSKGIEVDVMENGLRACSPEHPPERKNGNDNGNDNGLRACSPEHPLERKNVNLGEAAQELVKQLRMQNRVFLKFITTNQPWITAKWAMTLDGKIATSTGDSKWITNKQSRQRVHMLRKNNMAILCGIGTVIADDPMLNVRLSEESMQRLGIKEHEVRHPIRIVADRQARIPMESQLVSTAHEYPTIVAYGNSADEEKLQQLRDAGVVLWNCNTLTELVQRAGAEKIDSILLESGGTLSEALLSEGLIDEVVAFVAPKIIGGKSARTPVEGEGVTLMSEAIELEDQIVETIGSDVMISGLVKKSGSRD